MNERTQPGKYIFRLTTPYKDIFTSLYLVKTPAGDLLFDAGSFPEDAEAYTLPWLTELGVTKDSLKYIFISHPHLDHAGGLPALLPHFPTTRVVANVQDMSKYCADRQSRHVLDGELLLDTLRVVCIPGHTADSAALLDLRDNTLISGDCLQLYGIFGSGLWGANINFPAAHKNAIRKLRKMEIQSILPAHDYHPLGTSYVGQAEVAAALDACEAPLDRVLTLLGEQPMQKDEEICARYNEGGKLPTLAPRIVTAIRRDLF